MRRFFLMGLAACAVGYVCIQAPAAQHAPTAAMPISRMDLPWWQARHEAVLARLKTGEPVDLVWLGDSITQNWEKHGPPDWKDFAPVWAHYYGDRHALNLGFVGDTTASVLWRLDHGEVAGISPKAVVLLIGANNFGRVHWDAEQTLAGIDAIVGDLRHRVPGAKILLLGVLPSDRTDFATAMTVAVNRGLAKQYANVEGVTYMDVSSLFMPNGKLDRGMFYDPKETPPDPPLHPTAQAQEKIAETIEPTLAAMLGDPSKVQ